jgi:SAM-dependent methyltransferase
MNYVRLVELPLSLHLLETSPDDRVVDLSSPKLLSLYLAISGWKKLIISDIDDYFVADFRVFAECFRTNFDVRIIDARKISLPDASQDRVYSVSVFEHIPNMGDREALQEVARVLRPGGIFVLTLPAYSEYIEEWQTTKTYWDSHSIQRPDSTVFFQRRYDLSALQGRLGGCGFEFEEVIYVAERPIEEPRLGPNGRMLHNVYYLQERFQRERLWRWKRRIPLYPYYLSKLASKQYHYLTHDASDPNVRQVALKLRRQ